jgi:hypothetical protein
VRSLKTENALKVFETEVLRRIYEPVLITVSGGYDTTMNCMNYRNLTW